MEAAFSFLASVGPDSFEIEDFEKHCGVGMLQSILFTWDLEILLYETIAIALVFFKPCEGVEVTIEEIQKTVKSVVDENKDLLLTERYRVNGTD
jgi:hypothetical protein